MTENLKFRQKLAYFLTLVKMFEKFPGNVEKLRFFCFRERGK